MTQRRTWTDEQFDALLGHVLRAGVLLAAALVACGGVVHLIHGVAAPHYGIFRGEPGDLRSIGGIVADATSLKGRGIIQLGVLLLIATPIARVAFSVVGFLRQRDWLYVSITLVVLILLSCNLRGG